MGSRRRLRSAILFAACIGFVAVMATFSMAATRPAANGHKVKVTGPIVVRDADVVQILSWKDGSVHGFRLTDRTTITCEKGFLNGKTAMDSSALAPPLTIEVEAISSPEGIAEAKTIRYSPDPFATAAEQEKRARDLCTDRPDRFLLSWLLPW